MPQVPSLVVPFTDTIVLTNSPLAEREILGQTSWRLKLDLDAFIKCRVRLNVQTAGAVNSDVHFEASPDASTWYDITPEIALAPAGVRETAWMSLPVQVRVAGAWIRLREKDGDGVADPNLRQVLLEFN